MAGLAEVWEPFKGLKVIELDNKVTKPVRCFLLEGEKGHILIDTGYRETAEELLKAIQKNTIAATVLTHLHIDHSGGASAVKSNLKTKLIYHEKELYTLRQALKADVWVSKIFEDQKYAVLKSAIRSLVSLPEPDEFAVDEMVLGSCRLLHTPGHTPGHVILVCDEYALTGDLILQDDTSNVAYVPIDGYHSLTDYLKNIVRVAKFDVELILPSHGPVFKDCRQRVAEIFAHHFERLSQTAQALRKGLFTPLEVAEEINWSKGSYHSLPPFDKWLAILETLSHLDFLAEVGYAVQLNEMRYRLSEDGVWDNVKTRLQNIADGFWKT